MANVTWKNLNINKLNKTAKHLSKTGVLVGPRATKGSYGDWANILQASVDKREEKEKKRRPGPKQRRQRGPRSPRGEETSPKQREGQRGRRGIGIAVKGGGRIL